MAPRTARPESEIPFLSDMLAVGERAPSLERKVELARSVRTASPDGGRQLDRVLFDQLARTGEGLAAAQEAQEALRELLERLDSPPWHPALFLRAVETDLGPRAMVLAGGTRRVVALAEGLDVNDFRVGEEVFLGRELNVVAGRSPYGTPRVGETGHFERLMGDGRCVLRYRDEEVVVDAAASLAVAELRSGDQVRWDRAAWMAFERIDTASGRRFLVDDVSDVDASQVGGQAASLERLLSALTATLVDPEKARRYGLGGRRSILMVGPPGCGKTLMARIAASATTRRSGRRCHFAVVKPAEWESPFVGTTQENIRACFRALREKVADGSMAVLFLDEIEAVGRTRGGSFDQHGDKFLAALLAELDGFADRTGIAIIAATNRKDLLDAALLERISDVEILVRRPDMKGARAILGIHLPASVPIASGSVREDLIEAAVSRLYAPNADNAVATIRLRDAKTRTVAARELVSGRLLAQVCTNAREAAFARDSGGGEPGVCLADMEQAVAEAIEKLGTTLSRLNVRSYLPDLPQDVDVVSVEPVVRKVSRLERYRHVA